MRQSSLLPPHLSRIFHQVTTAWKRETATIIQGFPADLASFKIASNFNLVIPGEPSESQVHDLTGLVQLSFQLGEGLCPLVIEKVGDSSGGIDDLTSKVHLCNLSFEIYPGLRLDR
jgi:hypothetical protein